MSLRMVKTGLLILSNPAKISAVFPLIKQHVHKTIYVQLLPNQKNVSWHTSIPKLSRTVLKVYTQSARNCSQLDVRVLLGSLKGTFEPSKINQPIEIIILDKKYTKEEIDPFLKFYTRQHSHSPNILTVNQGDFEAEEVEISQKKEKEEEIEGNREYDYVCLGGTFDRLHSGHKILLSEAVIRCKKKLTVGVTDTNMIYSKKLWELIEPCEKRIESVREFLQDINPHLEYEIVPIQDPYGPTKHDPNIQLLVVSRETLKGGHSVNRKRDENGLPQVQLYCLDIVEQDQDLDEAAENKLSSTNGRLRLLGTRLRDPPPSSSKSYNGNCEPYVIGLVGGIASGKTSIAKRLVNLGAGHVDCDKLAHLVYKKDTHVFQQIVNHFGLKVINEMDGEIDRKKLGEIVFNDEEQRKKLEALVWPAMLDLALKSVNEHFKQGKKVVILDAAVLMRAKWDRHCHEIWTCLIPIDEAIIRVQDRDKIPHELAEKRVKASHADVALASQKSTVALCSFWSYQYTQGQVERAWAELQNYLLQSSRKGTKEKIS